MQNRYFLIAIRAIVNGDPCYANVTIQVDDGMFPSEAFIEKAYELECKKEKRAEVTSLIILSIFEFKNEEDYKSWTKAEVKTETN